VKLVRPLLFDLQTIVAWAHGEVPDAVVRRVHEGSKVYVSSVSPWEFLLKKNRQSFGLGYEDLMQTKKRMHAEFLPLKEEHLDRLEALPILKDQKGKDHADPFDRLLVAQALQEDFVLVGADQMFPIYQQQLFLKLLWEA